MTAELNDQRTVVKLQTEQLKLLKEENRLMKKGQGTIYDLEAKIKEMEMGQATALQNAAEKNA